MISLTENVTVFIIHCTNYPNILNIDLFASTYLPMEIIWLQIDKIIYFISFSK